MQAFTACFEDGDSVGARNGGEIIEELIQIAAVGQIIEQGPHRDAGAGKDGCASQNLEVALNRQGFKLRGSHRLKVKASDEAVKNARGEVFEEFNESFSFAINSHSRGPVSCAR